MQDGEIENLMSFLDSAIVLETRQELIRRVGGTRCKDMGEEMTLMHVVECMSDEDLVRDAAKINQDSKAYVAAMRERATQEQRSAAVIKYSMNMVAKQYCSMMRTDDVENALRRKISAMSDLDLIRAESKYRMNPYLYVANLSDPEIVCRRSVVHGCRKTMEREAGRWGDQREGDLILSALNVMSDDDVVRDWTEFNLDPTKYLCALISFKSQ